MSPQPAELKDLRDGDLVHPLSAFAPEAQRASAQDWGNSQTLEKFAWDYEVLGQLGRADDTVTAFGGTAAMLHLPILLQRASIDVDVFCPDADRFERAIRVIEAALQGRLNHPYFFKFSARDPELQIPIPKRAHHVVLPSATGASWKLADSDTLQPGTHIKIEVLVAEPPGRERLPATHVLPFAPTVPHWVVPKADITAMKLLALAAGEVGLPPNRIAELVKHVYDAAQLSLAFDDRNKVISLIDASSRALELENRWHTPRSKIEDCATAVRTTVDMLEATEIRERAKGFADTYLRSTPSLEEWSWWGKRVRYLAFVVAKRHSIDDYVETQRVADRLLRRNLQGPEEVKLRKALTRKLRSLDLASGTPSDQYPIVLFEEIAFRVGHRAAATEVAQVLGSDWDT